MAFITGSGADDTGAVIVAVGSAPKEGPALTTLPFGKPGDGSPNIGDWAGAAELAREHVDHDSDIHASAAYRRMLVGVLTARVLAEAVFHATANDTANDTAPRV